MMSLALKTGLLYVREKKEDAGATSNWCDPKEMYDKLYKLYDGSMGGKTMYVIPYSMGVVGSDFAKIGIELTASLSMLCLICL